MFGNWEFLTNYCQEHCSLSRFYRPPSAYRVIDWAMMEFLFFSPEKNERPWEAQLIRDIGIRPLWLGTCDFKGSKCKVLVSPTSWKFCFSFKNGIHYVSMFKSSLCKSLNGIITQHAFCSHLYLTLLRIMWNMRYKYQKSGISEPFHILCYSTLHHFPLMGSQPNISAKYHFHPFFTCLLLEYLICLDNLYKKKVEILVGLILIDLQHLRIDTNIRVSINCSLIFHITWQITGLISKYSPYQTVWKVLYSLAGREKKMGFLLEVVISILVIVIM